MALAKTPGRRLMTLGVVVAALGLVPLTAGEASANSCPNEALRSELRSAGLPDCRAYELVTPAAKNGWPVEVSGISPSGLNVLAISLGGFAGSDQTSLQSAYDSERTTAGWTTTPVASQPPGLSNLALANLLGESRDLHEGLFKYRLTVAANLSEGGFYVRSLPGGPPAEVGPEFSPTVLGSDPPGAEESSSEPSVSDDLGHLLFTIAGSTLTDGGSTHYLWPGDTTVENTGPLYGSQGFVSLYEYQVTGQQEPRLVGVSNEKALANNAEAQLISQCGTSLGFPAEGAFSSLVDDELYNAISASGSRVFFTAAGATQGPSANACTSEGAGSGPSADELFARTDGSETTAISEPSTGPKGDCSACNTGTPADAAFQGASEDGSKVFFLTTQPLLTSDEDNTTDLYEYDFNAPAGEKITQISVGGAGDGTPGKGANVQGVARISEDGSHVYFVAAGRLTTALSPAGKSARAEADNLYSYDTATKQTAFIGTLAEGDARDWQREDNRPVDATPDGGFLVFTSSADLTPDDTSSVQQVFEYDAQTETLVRVSRGQSGFNDDGNTGQYPATIVHGFYSGHLNPAFQPSSVSDNGSYVAFESEENLTPQALAGHNNVYEFHEGRVSLISDGQDRTFSTALVGIDPSGSDLFFTSADQLVPQDDDTQEDVYDARIGGGFSPPAGRSACEGAGCQGGFAPTPPLTAVGSASQPSGERVLAPPARRVVKPKTKARKKKAKRRGRAKAGSKHRGARKSASKKPPKERS